MWASSFLGFIKNLLPTISKNTINADLDAVNTELRRELIPSFRTAMPLLKGYKLKQKNAIELEQYIIANAKIKPMDGNVFNALAQIAMELPNTLDGIAHIVSDQNRVKGDTPREAMDLITANIMTYATAASLFTRYSRRLLSTVLTLEANAVAGGDPFAGIFQPEIDYLYEKLPKFAEAVASLKLDTESTLTAVRNIPDIVLSSANVADVDSTYDRAQIDPLNLKFAASDYNPIYYYRMNRAERIATQYHEAQAESKTLQLKITRLQRLLESKPDDENLKNTLSRLERTRQECTRKIEKLESVYG